MEKYKREKKGKGNETEVDEAGKYKKEESKGREGKSIGGRRRVRMMKEKWTKQGSIKKKRVKEGRGKA